jgi:Mn2+/Fe2+ NRAMP family transporter
VGLGPTASTEKIDGLAGKEGSKKRVGNTPALTTPNITMLPVLASLAVDANPSRSLVISQVVLFFGIPFALILLLIYCPNCGLMGALVNRRATARSSLAVEVGRRV